MTEQQQAANVILANTALYTVLSIVLALLLVPASIWLVWWLRQRKRRAQLRRTCGSIATPLGHVPGDWQRSTWQPTVHDWTTRKHFTPKG